MFKVNNRNTRTMCEICSKLTVLYLYCKLCTYFTHYSRVSIANFEQVNADWFCTEMIYNPFRPNVPFIFNAYQ